MNGRSRTGRCLFACRRRRPLLPESRKSQVATKGDGSLPFAAAQGGPSKVNINEARQYLGKNCAVTFLNRQGDEVTRRLHVNDVAFVPLYGAYLIGDMEDVSLERVTSIDTIDG